MSVVDYLTFAVDWDNNGNFTGTYDDISAYAQSADWSRGFRTTSPLEHISPMGVCNILVKNNTGFFSPSNTASPIYGLIKQRRPIRIQSTHGVNGWTYSEQIDNAVWSRTNIASVTVNAVAAPDGLTTAEKVIESSDGGPATHYLMRDAPTITADTTQAISIYAKAAERTKIKIGFKDKAGDYTYWSVNLSNGSVISGTNVAVEDCGSGWYRIKMTVDSASGAETPRVDIILLNAAGDSSYTGDGSSGFYLWGGQFEADSSTISGYDKTEAVAHPVTITQFQGYLDRIEITPALSKAHTALIRGYGSLGLTEQEISVPMHAAITTGDAIDDALDRANFPAGKRVLDTGQTTMARWWAPGKRKAYGILEEIAATEAGNVYESKAGDAVYEDRAHRLSAPHTAAQVSYRSDNTNPFYAFRGISQRDPTQDIVNIVKAAVRTYDKTDSITLWELSGDPPLIPAEGSITIWAELPSAATPLGYVSVLSWDAFNKTANSQQGGGGTDLTSYITVTPTKFANVCKMEISNSSGTPAYLTSLSITGVAIVEGDSLHARAEDAASKTDFGDRTYEYTAGFISNLAEGQNYCNHILALCKDPHPPVELHILAHRSLTQLNDALTRDISDRVHILADVAATSLGIDGEYFIEQIIHSVTRDGSHEVWLLCGPAVSHTWGAESTSYTPETVYPDDPWIPLEYIDDDMIADNAVIERHILAANVTAAKIFLTVISDVGGGDLGSIVAGDITGVIITGSRFQTSESGNPRFVVDEIGGYFYQTDAAGNTVVLGTSDGWLLVRQLSVQQNIRCAGQYHIWDDTSWHAAIVPYGSNSGPKFTGYQAVIGAGGISTTGDSVFGASLKRGATVMIDTAGAFVGSNVDVAGDVDFGDELKRNTVVMIDENGIFVGAGVDVAGNVEYGNALNFNGVTIINGNQFVGAGGVETAGNIKGTGAGSYVDVIDSYKLQGNIFVSGNPPMFTGAGGVQTSGPIQAQGAGNYIQVGSQLLYESDVEDLLALIGHTHTYSGTTELADGHQHDFSGETNPA